MVWLWSRCRGGIVGYLYLRYLSRQKRMEIIHQERMAAMEKGIPLPELPMELREPERRPPDPNVLPILGIVLFTLAIGTMTVLFLMRPAVSTALWVTPLPFALLGVGLLAFNFLKRKTALLAKFCVEHRCSAPHLDLLYDFFMNSLGVSYVNCAEIAVSSGDEFSSQGHPHHFSASATG
jgi:hypothetical protein